MSSSLATQAAAAVSSPSSREPQADQEGDFYQRLLRARKEDNRPEQALWLENLADLYLNKNDLTKAAHLLNGAYAVASNGSHLLKKIGKIEAIFLKSKGFTATDTMDRIVRQREHLKRIRQECSTDFEALGDYLDFISGKVNDLPLITQRLTNNYIELLKEIIEEAIGYTKPPPTAWACIGMGSMARQEMSPYSDLEFAFIIENSSEEARDYFRTLTELITFMIINLGETKFPIFSTDLDHPSATPGGISMDSGGNTPLGVRDYYELIGTASELAKFVQSEWIDRNIILANAMSAVCYIAGNQILLESYEMEKNRSLSQLTERGTNRELLTFKLLEGHLEEFKPNLNQQKESISAFGVKKELYRPFQEILGCLALVFDLKKKNSLERVHELQQRHLLSNKGLNNLVLNLSNVLYLRIKAHLFYREEKEFFLHRNDENPVDDSLLYLSFDDKTRLEFIYATLLEFHRCAEVFQQTKNEKSFSQSDMEGELSSAAVNRKLTMPQQIPMVGKAGYLIPKELQGLPASELVRAIKAMNDAHQDDTTTFQQALTLNPDDWFSARRMGEEEFKQNKYDQALHHFFKASRHVLHDCPQAAMIHYRIGQIYYYKNENDQAAEHLKRAITLQFSIYRKHEENPVIETNIIGSEYFNLAYDLAMMHDDLADIESKLKKYPEAIKNRMRVLKLIPKIKGSPQVPINYDSQTKLELNTFIALGKEHRFLKNLSEAQNFLSQALSLLKKLEEIPFWRDIYLYYHIVSIKQELAHTYEDKGNYQEAIKLYFDAVNDINIYRKVLSKWESRKDSVIKLNTTLISIYFEISEIYYLVDDYANALKFSNAAMKELAKAHPGKEYPTAYGYLYIGRIYARQGKYVEALEAHERGFKLTLRNAKNEDSAELAVYYYWMAWDYFYLGQFRKALDWAEKSLKIDQIHSQANTIEGLGLLGWIHGRLGKYGDALACFDQSHQLAIKLNQRLADSHESLSWIHCHLGESEKSLEYIQKSLDDNLKQYGPENSRVAQNYLIQGMAFGRSGEFQKAIEVLSKAMSIFLKVYGRNHELIAECHELIATARIRLNLFKEAINELQLVLKIRINAYANKNHPYFAKTYKNMAFVFNEQKDDDKAFDMYKKAILIGINSDFHEHPDFQECLYKVIAICERKHRHISELKQIYGKCLQVFLKENDILKKMEELISKQGK